MDLNENGDINRSTIDRSRQGVPVSSLTRKSNQTQSKQAQQENGGTGISIGLIRRDPSKQGQQAALFEIRQLQHKQQMAELTRTRIEEV